MAGKNSSRELRTIDPNVSADRLISTTRFVSATPNAAFSAFTKERHLVHWWLDPRFTIKTHSLTLEPGGTWWSTVTCPDRYSYLQAVTYSQIEWAQVLSFYVGDAAEPDLMQTHVTFEASGSKTRLTMLSIFASVKGRDDMLAKQQPEDSHSWLLDRLCAYLARSSV